MESSLSIQAVAILSAIPVVAYALWADYFTRAWTAENATKKNEEEMDRVGASFRARSVGFLVLIAELALFLGTTETRKDHPLLGNIVFIIAVLVQATIQAGIDRKLGTPAAHPRHYVGIAAKTILWALTAALGYAMIVLLSMRLALFAAVSLGAGKEVTAVLVVFGAIFGLMAGLAANFALAPVYLSRGLLPIASPNPETIARLNELFENAGMRAPAVHLIHADRAMQGGTAFIAGFTWGRGPIRPALFISESLLKSLSDSELSAVIHHEIAHLKLAHLPRRLLLASGIVVGTFTLGIAATLLLPSMNGPLMPLLALGSFLATFQVIGAQSREQEFQADAYAITSLGSHTADLCSALRKIDRMNGTPADSEGSNHPATERRIKALAALGPTEHADSERKAA